MKLVLLFIIVTILIYFIFKKPDVIEYHRGHGRRGHPHGRYSKHRRHPMRYRRDRQYRRPRNYYDNWWGGEVDYVGGAINYNCRDGCVKAGDGWGCQFPGNGNNSCLFASDCKGCGNISNPQSYWFWE